MKGALLSAAQRKSFTLERSSSSCLTEKIAEL